MSLADAEQRLAVLSFSVHEGHGKQ